MESFEFPRDLVGKPAESKGLYEVAFARVVPTESKENCGLFRPITNIKRIRLNSNSRGQLFAQLSSFPSLVKEFNYARHSKQRTLNYAKLPSFVKDLLSDKAVTNNQVD